MTKQALPQSQKRFLESVGALFDEKRKSSENFVFLKSSSDIGVIRNGGRNGARFAPQSFLSTFKKFSQNEALSHFTFFEYEVGSIEEEQQDFHKAQLQEAHRISSHIADHPSAWICHLGGGHDHVYSLLESLSKKFQKIIVINIDAHADTRTDEDFHSGTPFRQFAEKYSGDFHIFQIGLNPFANSFSTLSPLTRGQSEVLWKKDFSLSALDRLFQKITKLMTQETLVLFSLDTDALIASEVPGVSAINPSGFTRAELQEIWKRYKTLNLSHKPIIGIYELNPLFDTLSNLSMRTIGSFVFEAIEP